MKKIFFVIVLMSPVFSYGADYVFSGDIKFITSHDSQLGANIDWIGIEGFTSAGQCGVDSGVVVIRLRDDERARRHLSMAISAYMVGKPVSGKVDDSVRDSGGYCFLKYIKYSN